MPQDLKFEETTPIFLRRSDKSSKEYPAGQGRPTRNDIHASQAPYLPFELWEQILSLFGSDAMDPYDLDDLDTLPTQLRLADWKTGSPQIQKWKNLRLVCRTWYRILATSPMLVFHGNKSVASAPEQLTSRVHVAGNDIALYQFTKFRQSIDVSSQITTLSFASSSRQPSGITRFLAQGESLPNVRNLSLDTPCIVGDLWSRLELGFPDLVVLRLKAIDCNRGGTFTLRHLEFFELHSYITNPPIFRFPSLRHLWGKTFCNNPRLAREHRHQLTSALDLNYHGLFHDIESPTFWETFPKVRLVATMPSSLKEITAHPQMFRNTASRPPDSHPIEHLMLTMDLVCAHNPPDTMQILCDVLERWPLRRLSIDAQGLTPWETFWVKRRCAHHGVAWTPLPPKPYPNGYTRLHGGALVVARWVLHSPPVLNFVHSVGNLMDSII